MLNTWVWKIQKNEIIQSQNRKTEDTLPPLKLEVKLIVERVRANKQRYVVVYLPECKLRRSKTLSLEDIKSNRDRKQRSNANLMGCRLEIVERKR